MTALPLVLLGLAVALFMRSRSEPARLPGEPPREPAPGPELGPSREAGPSAPPREPIAEPAAASDEDRAIASDELGAMLLLDARKVQPAIEHIESQIGITLDGLRLYVAELGQIDALPGRIAAQALSAAIHGNQSSLLRASQTFGADGFRQIAAQLETIAQLRASRSFTPRLVLLVRDVAEHGPPGGLPAAPLAPEPSAPPPPPPPPPPETPVASPDMFQGTFTPPIPGPPPLPERPSDHLLAIDELGAMTTIDLGLVSTTIAHLASFGIAAVGLAAYGVELVAMTPAERTMVEIAIQPEEPANPLDVSPNLSAGKFPQTIRQVKLIYDLRHAPSLPIARVRRLAEEGKA